MKCSLDVHTFSWILYYKRVKVFAIPTVSNPDLSPVEPFVLLVRDTFPGLSPSFGLSVVLIPLPQHVKN